MTAPSNRPAAAKPLFERVVETLATGLGDSIGWLAERGVLFAIFAMIWVGFLAALAMNPQTLDDTWRYAGSLPLVVQLLLWLLLLPVMGALWVWESTWPFLLRIALVLGLAGWTLLVFRPKWLRWPARVGQVDDKQA